MAKSKIVPAVDFSDFVDVSVSLAPYPFAKLPLDALPARGTPERAEYRLQRRRAARAARKAARAAA
jgi:hypothetical protein